MVESIDCKLVKWGEIHESAERVAERIKQSKFTPDYVVAIARGGVVPARLLCDELHLKNFVSIKADHWGITATKDGSAELSHGTSVDLSGKKLLLVDDITDTGESMKVCVDYLQSLDPKEVRTVALYHLKGSEFTPDYYGQVQDWKWMIWPWNYKEDVVNLTKKVLNDDVKEPNEIQEVLLENFNIYLEQEEVKEVLEHINYLNER